MSVLELNGRVFDASTTGTLTLTSEGGAVTTDVTQGLAKAWCRGGTDAGVSDSLNVLSSTDNGTGNYTYSFSSSLSNTTYVSNTAAATGNDRNATSNSTIASSFVLEVFDQAGNNTDSANLSTIHGDLA